MMNPRQMAEEDMMRGASAESASRMPQGPPAEMMPDAEGPQAAGAEGGGGPMIIDPTGDGGFTVTDATGQPQQFASVQDLIAYLQATLGA
jgi:hypothetical protein